MEISVFKALGPIMIGPSSSHTAGAAKIAKVARLIAGEDFSRVTFGLCGSFAHTYKGHGTDRALVAGALGFSEDDERLSDSFELAKKAGLSFEFYDDEIEGAHENTVRVTFYMNNGSVQEIIGSSIGGGQIKICGVNGFITDISAQSGTLLITQRDRRGVVSDVSRVLADNQINIAAMKVSRSAKGETAFCTIETDSPLSDEIVDRIKKVENVLTVHAINIGEKEG